MPLPTRAEHGLRATKAIMMVLSRTITRPSPSNQRTERCTPVGQGDFDGAIADFTKAIEVYPFMANWYYQARGKTKFHKADYDGAVADYNQAIKLNPKFAGFYVDRGWLETIQERYDAAMADFDQAADLDPKFCRAFDYRGIVKRLRGDWDDALNDFRQYNALSQTLSDHDNAHLLIWVTRVRKGNNPEANQELSDYLAKRPDGKREDWPSRIGQFLLDKLAESDFVARSQNSVDGVAPCFSSTNEKL